MKQFVEIMVVVIWLIGASAAGLTVEWAGGPIAAQKDVRDYAMTSALQFTMYDDQVALVVRIPALPWRMGLMTPVPSSLILSFPEASVAGAASNDALFRRGDDT